MKKVFLYSVLCVLLLLPARLSAQQVVFDLSQQSVDQKQIIAFDIKLDTDGYFVNAFELYVKVDEKIHVHEISRSESVVDLWVADPRYDETTSQLVFIGGMTAGTVMKEGLIGRVYVSFSEGGHPAFALDPAKSAVYLDDGFGTKKSLPLTTSTLTVSEHEYVPGIEIYSPTHPSEDTWYAQNTIRVGWDVPATLQVSYELGQSFQVVPDDAPELGESPVVFSEVADGEYVFAIKKQMGNAVWSEPFYRRFRVDTTKPEITDVQLFEDSALFDGKRALVFRVFDETSGLQSVTIAEDNSVVQDVRSPYVVQGDPEEMTITAQDAAGNIETYTLTRKGNERALPTLGYIFGISFLVLLLLLLWFRHRATLENDEHRE